MKYEKIWQKTLNESEKVEYEFSVAKGYRKLLLITGLVTLIFGGFGIIFLILYWYSGLNAYAFTNKRILVHTGWLSTKSTSINYDKIVEVSVSEGFIDRVFAKSGNLAIKTSGLGHDIVLKNIESPYETKKILDRLSHHA